MARAAWARTAPAPTPVVTSTPAAGAVPADAESRTRDRVAYSLLLERAVTASAISTELGLTPAAVRRHLDALVAEELAEPVDAAPTGQRGRPARTYRLTDAGRERFPQAYDDLARQALAFVFEQGGGQALAAFARTRATAIENRMAEGDEPVVRRLADALDAEGYATSLRPVGSGAQLCQHHCPVAHVATAFPQLCEAETEVFAKVLGRHVQRLATIANGDGVCTTHIPGPIPAVRTHSDTTVSGTSPSGTAHDPGHGPAEGSSA